MLEVGSEKVTLNGLHRFEREVGFKTSEFKQLSKIPQAVDPTTVTSLITQDGVVLIIEGMKCSEKRVKDRRFEAKLDFIVLNLKRLRSNTGEMS